MKPGRHRRIVTAALLLGLSLAAIEATAVATAMPTAIGELSGVGHYSWVFSVYLLTSTATMPLFGKLADLYGRRRIYHLAVALFLVGSALSGLATSLAQLIGFRALQGLGAGGVSPVAITVIGDIYDLEERGRVQGLIAAVWAASSLVGPLVGGTVTDLLSWRGVFYLGVPVGVISAWLLERHLGEALERRPHHLDAIGSLSLTASISFLLLGLVEGGDVWGWADPRTQGLFLAAAASFVVFLWQEGRAPEPMLPLDLFRIRLIAVASAGNTVLGMLLFGLVTFVPVFGQGVLRGTAVDAGAMLMPMSIGWPLASTLGGWVLLKVGYRTLLFTGGAFTLAGTTTLALAGAGTGRVQVMAAMFVIGFGLGCMSMPYLLGPQNAVPHGRRGVATSSVQFFRSIGGAVSVAVLGALFNARRATGGGDLDPNAAFDPALRAALAPEKLQALESSLLHGLQGVFLTLLLIAATGVAVSLLFPRGGALAHAHREPPPGPNPRA